MDGLVSAHLKQRESRWSVLVWGKKRMVWTPMEIGFEPTIPKDVDISINIGYKA